MLVTYTKPNVMTVFLSNMGDTTMTHEKPFLFKPGTNSVPDEDWKTMKKEKNVITLIEKGVLLPIGDESKDCNSIVDVRNFDEANAIIARTYDLRLLDEWMQSETRPAVSNAITKQIENIYAKTNKPKED